MLKRLSVVDLSFVVWDVHGVYTTILSARMTMETREGEVGIQLTLEISQEKQEWSHFW